MPLIRDTPPDELSPYLEQHQDNPVDWYTWGPDALERAQRDDRPLLISIGYAACHWCHVMAHESFESPEIAAEINASFIAIKVDREERPDLDQLYMSATQAMTGQGGWPMTVIATPDGRPFFAGTYFPPVDRGGQPGFPRVIAALSDAWQNQRDAVEQQADEVAAAMVKEARFLDTLASHPTEQRTDFDQALGVLATSLGARFDPVDGGFGGAPKFPRPSYVEALLVHARRTGDLSSLSMATTTLDAMAAGGIYDHLAGGFARYSVDASWLIPHFEKMLTDQALLARVYLHAFLATGDVRYENVVAETLDWVLHELAVDSGGLAASVDADAAGAEGSHAVFTPAEVADALAGVDGALSAAEACDFYGITDQGTFEHGSSVLARARRSLGPRTEAEEATREALLAARRRRLQPTIDDKILVEWNAMAASVLAEAASVLGVERWGLAAARIVTLLDGSFRDEQGRLLRSARGGVARHLGMLGDHAWLIEAMTRLYEFDGEGQWLERARSIAQEMVELFYDGPPPSAMAPNAGAGFFTTGADADALLVRSKDLFDGALPSATATAATALARLSNLTEDPALAAIADRCVAIADPVLAEQPEAVPDLLLALGWLRESIEVAVPGPPGLLLDTARRAGTPFTVFAFGEDVRSPLLADRSVGSAYVCRHGTCQMPAQDPATVVEQLRIASTR